MENKEKYAYIAGLVDGEGSFGIVRWLAKGCVNPIFSERLTISMMNKEPLQFIKDTFEGTLYREEKKGFFGKRYKLWRYSITNKKCVDVLLKIYPYMIEKKKQVECLFKLRELQGKGNSKGINREKLLKEREALHARIKELNNLRPIGYT